MKNVIAILCVTVLTGCMIPSSLVVKNRTNGPIVLKTYHTGKSYTVENDKSLEMPHSRGDLDISTTNGQKWHYTNVVVAGTQGVVKRHKMIFITCLKLYVLVSPDGTLHVLPGGKRNNYTEEQPPGYPMRPQKE